LHTQPLFVISFAEPDQHAVMAAMMGGGAVGGLPPAALAALAKLGFPKGPPPPAPPLVFQGTPHFAAGPIAPPRALAPSYSLRHAAAAAAGAPASRCGACAAQLAPRELALGRSAQQDTVARLVVFHLRCAVRAPWAAEFALQPLLRELRGAALTAEELAEVYETLGSDEKRALRQQQAG
jgi:hypothetical protein